MVISLLVSLIKILDWIKLNSNQPAHKNLTVTGEGSDQFDQKGVISLGAECHRYGKGIQRNRLMYRWFWSFLKDLLTVRKIQKTL